MKFAGLFFAALLLHQTSFGADWPQWRGLERTGISSEEANHHWPPEGPTVLWRASVGTGFSSVSIAGGRACTMGNANDQEAISCFDAATGTLLWKHTYPSPLGPVYHEGGPVSTPTIESNQ